MSVKIIYRPVKKDDKKGFLKIRIIENRKAKIKSLGIKITGRNWLSDKQRVSKSEPNHKKINDKIEETLKDLSKYDKPQQAIATNNKTILEFYNSIIDNTVNAGTKIKYKGVRDKFKKYLNTIGYEDLKFHQLNQDIVQGFYKFMRSDGCAQNTANYNMKSFKSIINKGIKAGIINYYHDPFSLLKLKYTEVKNRTLTRDEVDKLLKSDFKDKRKMRYNSLGISLNEITSVFLFQLFAQGMRISDVQLLKWSNFEVNENGIFLDYFQFKTKKNITLKITLLTCKLLINRLLKYDSELDERINKIELDIERYREEILKAKKLLDEANNSKDITKIKHLFEESENNKNEAIRLSWIMTQEQHIKNNELLLEKANDKVYKEFKTLIKSLSNGVNSNDFVFHFLSGDKLFSNYKYGEELTSTQYTRLQGTRSYYNTLLKEIQKQANIKLNLSSHVARHTYTQLILNNEADIVAVSKALGHTHISTTQTYISKLPNSKLLDINDGLSQNFDY